MPQLTLTAGRRRCRDCKYCPLHAPGEVFGFFCSHDPRTTENRDEMKFPDTYACAGFRPKKKEGEKNGRRNETNA